ncbi:MAG: D-alanine--D-alanine ligase [Gammaproteobacteria bacterium]|jgi:D-alanine-D-alanine ligase|nr:D-alanine--D-alanine ligase [Gammaproteobacteria bacterium]
MIKHSDLAIAVIFGGTSIEAEVSRVSSQGVAKALSENYHNVILLELNADLAEQLKQHNIELVFPIVHGRPGEDGTLQGFLETLRLPYVGSGVLASACAMDKAVAKQIFKAYGLPVAKELIVHRSEAMPTMLQKIYEQIGEQCVVKPTCEGSGLGVSFPQTDQELEQALGDAFALNERVLVEERIYGKEITVAVLERPSGIEALPVIEITTPSNTWYDYAHRYTAGWSEHIIPAPLPADQYRRTQEVAVQAHQALQCRDFSRADFVVPEQGDPILLEVNTLPGMTPTSLYPDAAKAIGISFSELMAYLVENAWQRRS